MHAVKLRIDGGDARLIGLHQPDGIDPARRHVGLKRGDVLLRHIIRRGQRGRAQTKTQTRRQDHCPHLPPRP